MSASIKQVFAVNCQSAVARQSCMSMHVIVERYDTSRQSPMCCCKKEDGNFTKSFTIYECAFHIRPFTSVRENMNKNCFAELT